MAISLIFIKNRFFDKNIPDILMSINLVQIRNSINIYLAHLFQQSRQIPLQRGNRAVAVVERIFMH